MPAKRPKPRPPRAGTLVQGVDEATLNEMANRVAYKGSPKHKFGMWEGGVGRPGPNPTTIDEARTDPPVEPYAMICPEKWNHRIAAATGLLRAAIRRGQIGHPVDNGLPEYVWARDPDDPSIVYKARRLSAPDDSAYKAYPLIDAEVSQLNIEVR